MSCITEFAQRDATEMSAVRDVADLWIGDDQELYKTECEGPCQENAGLCGMEGLTGCSKDLTALAKEGVPECKDPAPYTGIPQPCPNAPVMR